MKKGFSILLLIVFLFNVGGYYIVFWGIHFQLDQQLSRRIEANLFDHEETVELKIPVTLPYPIHSQGFQRVDGRFEHQGQFYKLIKHKLQNDTLYVVCIKDYQTRALVSTFNDYLEITMGLTGTSPSEKALSFLAKLIKDFCPEEDVTILHHDGFARLILFHEENESFSQPVLAINAPPPRS